MPSRSPKSRWTATACWSISTPRTRSPNSAPRSSQARPKKARGRPPPYGRHARVPISLPFCVVHQISGEIRRLQLEVDPVAVAGKRARDDNMVLDRGGGQAEHAEGALQFRIDVRVDHLFLALEPVERLFLAQALDRFAADDLPIGFAGPAGRGERFGVIVADADFVDVLAEPDIGGPAAERGAACDIKYRHPPLPSRFADGAE